MSISLARLSKELWIKVCVNGDSYWKGNLSDYLNPASLFLVSTSSCKPELAYFQRRRDLC
jgi:hypothetical protein